MKEKVIFGETCSPRSRLPSLSFHMRTHSSRHALPWCMLYTLSLFLVRMIGESERLILHVQHKWKKNLTRCLIDFSPTVRFTSIVYKSLLSLEDYRTHDNASFHNLAPPPMSFSSHLPTYTKEWGRTPWNLASRRFLWWGAIRFWGAQYRNGGLIPNDNFFPNVNNIFSDMDDNGNTNASTADAPYAILSFLIENMLEFPFLPFGLDLLPPIRKEYRCWHFFFDRREYCFHQATSSCD
jgi:hypothetical protein